MLSNVVQSCGNVAHSTSCLAARTSSSRRIGALCGASCKSSGFSFASCAILTITSANASSACWLSVSVGLIISAAPPPPSAPVPPLAPARSYRSEHWKSSLHRAAVSPLSRKQPRRQRPQPLKHPARPTESGNQNPQQRRADAPDGQRAFVYDGVKVARPASRRRRLASRRAAWGWAALRERGRILSMVGR